MRDVFVRIVEFGNGIVGYGYAAEKGEVDEVRCSLCGAVTKMKPEWSLDDRGAIHGAETSGLPQINHETWPLHDCGRWRPPLFVPVER